MLSVTFPQRVYVVIRLVNTELKLADIAYVKCKQSRASNVACTYYLHDTFIEAVKSLPEDMCRVEIVKEYLKRGPVTVEMSCRKFLEFVKAVSEP